MPISVARRRVGAAKATRIVLPSCIYRAPVPLTTTSAQGGCVAACVCGCMCVLRGVSRFTARWARLDCRLVICLEC